jgi:TatD DNase family protein
MIQQDHARVIRAIGECGLDVTEGFPPLDQQIPWFQAQVRWAQQLQMPLFVHERNAFHETTKLLQHTSVPVLIHCFTGTPSECQHYVERGYSISVSGHVCKPAGQSVRDCLSQRLIPWDKLMIETDAPYMGFESCRTHYLAKHNNVTAKQRKRLSKGTYPNVPSSLPLVLQQVVECLNENPHYPPVTVEHVAKLTTENARRFFGFA